MKLHTCLSLGLGVAAVIVALASCSSSEFTGCEETFTCAPQPDASAGSGGTAGVAGSSGTSGAGSSGEAGATGDAGGGGPTTGLGSPCTVSGTLSCQGPAQKLTLICKDGVWQANQTCATDENCDQSSGACGKIVDECMDHAPGDVFCQPGDILTQCGPDLVSSDVTPCDGLCIDTTSPAACADPACGDGKLEGSEECDDANTAFGDGCSANCHWEVKAIAASGSHACALAENGTVKCWGSNSKGELGVGDTSSRGDGAGEMGTSLPTVNLGAGRSAKALALAPNDSCAILDDNSVKCWGDNADGQLGQGDSVTRGDSPQSMGDALAPIDFGTGRTVASIAIGGVPSGGSGAPDATTACAILDNFALKCWGANGWGQLGTGSTAANHWGNMAGQMGSALVAVAIPATRHATHVAVGGSHVCAILDDGSLYCWGNGDAGQLGQGNTNYTNPTPMAVPIDAKEIKELALTEWDEQYMNGNLGYTCVRFADNSVKCWGKMYQLTYAFATTPPNNYGDTSQTFPVDIPALRSGATMLAVGGYHLCLLPEAGSNVACFAAGNDAVIGYSSSSLTAGTVPPTINLGSGRKVIQLVAGGLFTCALLDDRSVKCWGYNDQGQLGQGDRMVRGSSMSDFGDNLPVVDLGF